MTARLLIAAALFVWAQTASAQTLTTEREIGELRLGQRVLVDDGTCPAGQVKEVAGANMTAAGVTRARRCVPRTGPKKR